MLVQINCIGNVNVYFEQILMDINLTLSIMYTIIKIII